MKVTDAWLGGQPGSRAPTADQLIAPSQNVPPVLLENSASVAKTETLSLATYKALLQVCLLFFRQDLFIGAVALCALKVTRDVMCLLHCTVICIFPYCTSMYMPGAEILHTALKKVFLWRQSSSFLASSAYFDAPK